MSFLINGTTDAGNQLIVVVYTYKNEVTSEITTSTRYFSVHTSSRADDNAILRCIQDVLKQVGIQDLLESKCVLGIKNFPVLGGGSTDGAAVSVAESGGLKDQLMAALPWIYWSCCCAHRLELAYRDAFTSLP